MEQNGMVQNERKVPLNPTAATKTGPCYVNGSVICGTHDGKIVRRGKRNGKMA